MVSSRSIAYFAAYSAGIFLYLAISPVSTIAGSPEADVPKADTPKRADDLAAPVVILAEGKPLEVAGFAAPCVGDMDGDGIADLLVGQRDLGRLRIYKNRGTNAAPKFTSFEWFVAGGRPAAVTNCCRISFTPQLVDFDGDGRTDLLTGSGRGTLFLFRRTPQGTFSAAEVLEDRDGQVQLVRDFPIPIPIPKSKPTTKPTTWPYNSTVFAHDWDSDGDLDLLLGRGPVCRIPNLGSAGKPLFGAAKPVVIKGDNFQRQSSIPPLMADWDGDGLDDLLCGHRGNIVWHRNIGKKGTPLFDKARILVAESVPVTYRYQGTRQPANFHAMSVADFNADGRLDLLVGDHMVLPRDPNEPPELVQQRRVAADKTAQQREKLLGRYNELRRQRPADETREQRIDRHRRALDAWQAWQSLYVSHQASRYRARVWFYERTSK